MEKQNKPFSIKARLRSFKYAFRGISLMFKEEHNSWIHISVTIIVIIFGIWLKLSTFEWLFIILAIGLVFVAELFNSSIENLGDAISKDQNKKIGNSKDLAAAGVLIASICSAIIGLLIFIPHLLEKISL